jgi:hypothetical protein
MKETRKRGIRATEEGLKRLKAAQAAKRNYEGKVWTYRDISIEAGVDESTVKRFFNIKQGVDKKSALSIAQALNLEITEIVNANEWNPLTTTQTDNDWRNVCLAMLEAEKRLTTNQLMRDEDDRFDLEEIHVPLALVERKKTDKHGEEILPEQGSRLYEQEYEEKQRFEQEQFLLDILKDGKGKHNGKRIAIIGEPGAGKTTLLRKIAFWVQKNTEILPILISLADLPETNPKQEFLEQFLLDKWLKAALPYISSEMVEVTEALKTELKKLCNRGRVWLLLDGVDEMPVQGEEPLWTISNQLKGWVGQTRVVLTCRLNIWEANRNVLADNFEIYRTLEFSYGDSTTPDRVGEFIAKWFNKQPNLGQQLRQELDKPGKKRIKDLAKNPLRLALLCSTWKLWRDRGGLPDTKAKLYQGFVEKFYEWKSKEFPTSCSQQEQLNRALGELAKLAIDRPTSRFRLKHSWVCQVLGKPDEGLFKLALQLGWLNNVGLAAESPDETVYAFWHPTFEEYLAATATNDWDFFLPRQHQNKPVADKYRIFEPQWKEVILLWLGREEIAQYQKEELIKTLLNFEDGCGQFYLHLARLLIFYYLYEFGYLNKVAIEAFIDCDLTKNLDTFLKSPAKYIKGLLRLYKYGPVGGLNFDLREWLDSMPEVLLIQEEVDMRLGDLTFLSMPESFLIERKMSLNQSNLMIDALKHINSTANINSLIQYLNIESKQDICVTKFGNKLEGNRIILEMEFNEEAARDSDIRREATIRLMEISRNDPTPVAVAASQAIYTSQNEHTLRLLTWLLGEIAPGNLTVFNSLVYLLHTNQDKLTRVGVIDSLQKVIQRGDLLQVMVEKLKNNLTYQVYTNDPDLYNECFRILLYYTQTMPYPAFYQAWYNSPNPSNS